MITNFDFSILNFIQNTIKCDFLDFIMPKITYLGDAGFIWILIGIVMLFFKKHRKCGIILIIALSLGAIFGNLILKPLIARPRPFSIDEFYPLLIDKPKDFSFPSGHTLASVTSAYVLTYYNRRWGYAVIPLACLIAFSRLYLYVHFPTDIIGGTVIGILAGYLTVKSLKNKLEKFLY